MDRSDPQVRAGGWFAGLCKDFLRRRGARTARQGVRNVVVLAFDVIYARNVKFGEFHCHTREFGTNLVLFGLIDITEGMVIAENLDRMPV